MPFRSLGSYEKKLLSQYMDGSRNGIVFSAKFSAIWDETSDDATLFTVGECCMLKSVISKALKKLIAEHIELYTTINEKLYFTPIKVIKPDDVIEMITIGHQKDAFVHCHLDPPPYVVSHIFNKFDFKIGCGKPLWKLYIVNESILIFHGHDVLFDIFSAATFINLFMKALHSASNSPKKIDYLFKFDERKSNCNYHRSIYENPKLHLPSMATDLLNLQTQSFLKNLYNNTIKKPIGLFAPHQKLQVTEFKLPYPDIINGVCSLYGTTVIKVIGTERFKHLNIILKQENICFRSFICSIAMLCLKPLIRNFNGNIIFSIPINLRPFIDDSSDLGLFYKNIRVVCPLSLVNDDINKNSGADSKGNKITLEDQFKNITKYVSNILNQRKKIWLKFG